MIALYDISELDAVVLSLQVGAVATAAGLVPAIALAYWLARSKSRFRALVDAIVILPMVLPPVVVGYFLLIVLGRRGFLGQYLDTWLGIRLPFTWLGAALAAMILGFPLMVRSMRQAFEAVDPALEDAARTLGASRMRVFRTVTLPLALPGCIAGAALCFARSLGEFGATVTFAGNIEGETRTLPLAIWTAMQDVSSEAAALRLAWICVAISLVATLTSELLIRRSRGGSR